MVYFASFELRKESSFMYGFVKRAVLKWVKVGVERVEKKTHLPQQQKRDVLWNDCTAVIVLPAK